VKLGDGCFRVFGLGYWASGMSLGMTLWGISGLLENCLIARRVDYIFSEYNEYKRESSLAGLPLAVEASRPAIPDGPATAGIHALSQAPTNPTVPSLPKLHSNSQRPSVHKILEQFFSSLPENFLSHDIPTTASLWRPTRPTVCPLDCLPSMTLKFDF
jgi:hypothetical protein